MKDELDKADINIYHTRHNARRMTRGDGAAGN